MRRLALALAVATLATVSSPATASDGSWQPHQYALGAVAIGLHVADWGQTRHIAVEPENYYEKNPITSRVIGRQPSTGGVDAYMLGTGAAFMLAAHLLPEYRTAILTVWAATRLQVVMSNHEIGLRIGGSF